MRVYPLRSYLLKVKFEWLIRASASGFPRQVALLCLCRLLVVAWLENKYKSTMSGVVNAFVYVAWPVYRKGLFRVPVFKWKEVIGQSLHPKREEAQSIYTLAVNAQVPFLYRAGQSPVPLI